MASVRRRDAVRSLAGVSELEDWVLHGATWRPLAIDEQRVVLELCSCSGEPMDVVESKDATVIEYVRNCEPEES
jgi:hypothetical protein